MDGSFSGSLSGALSDSLIFLESSSREPISRLKESNSWSKGYRELRHHLKSWAGRKANWQELSDTHIMNRRLNILQKVVSWFNDVMCKGGMENIVFLYRESQKNFSEEKTCVQKFSEDAVALSHACRTLASLGLKLLQIMRALAPSKTEANRWKFDQRELSSLEIQVLEVTVLKDDIDAWNESVSSLNSLFHGAEALSTASRTFTLAQVLENGQKLFENLVYLYENQKAKIHDNTIELQIIAKVAHYEAKDDSHKRDIQKTSEELRDLKENLIPTTHSVLKEAALEQASLKGRIKEKKALLEAITKTPMDEMEQEETTEISVDPVVSSEIMDIGEKRDDYQTSELDEYKNLAVLLDRELWKAGSHARELEGMRLSHEPDAASTMEEEEEEETEESPSISVILPEVVRRLPAALMPEESSESMVMSTSAEFPFQADVPEAEDKDSGKQRPHHHPMAQEPEEVKASTVPESARASTKEYDAFHIIKPRRELFEKLRSEAQDSLDKLEREEIDHYGTKRPQGICPRKPMLSAASRSSEGYAHGKEDSSKKPSKQMGKAKKKTKDGKDATSWTDSYTGRVTHSSTGKDVHLGRSDGKHATSWTDSYTGRVTHSSTGKDVHLGRSDGKDATSWTDSYTGRVTHSSTGKDVHLGRSDGKDATSWTDSYTGRVTHSSTGKDVHLGRSVSSTSKQVIEVEVPTEIDEWIAQDKAEPIKLQKHEVEGKTPSTALLKISIRSGSISGEHTQSSTTMMAMEKSGHSEDLTVARASQIKPTRSTSLKTDTEEYSFGTGTGKSDRRGSKLDQRGSLSSKIILGRTGSTKREETGTEKDSLDSGETICSSRKAAEHHKPSHSEDLMVARASQIKPTKSTRSKTDTEEYSFRTGTGKSDRKGSKLDQRGSLSSKNILGRSGSTKGEETGTEKDSLDFGETICSSRKAAEHHKPRESLQLACVSQYDGSHPDAGLESTSSDWVQHDLPGSRSSSRQVAGTRQADKSGSGEMHKRKRRLKKERVATIRKGGGPAIDMMKNGLVVGVEGFEELLNETVGNMEDQDLPQHVEELLNLDSHWMGSACFRDAIQDYDSKFQQAMTGFEDTFSSALHELTKRGVEQVETALEKKQSPLSQFQVPSGIEQWKKVKSLFLQEEQQYSTLLLAYHSLWISYNLARKELHMDFKKEPEVSTEPIREEVKKTDKKIVPTIADAMPQIIAIPGREAPVAPSSLPKEWKEELGVARDAFDEGTISYQEYMEQVVLLLKFVALLQYKVQYLGNSFSDMYLKTSLTMKADGILAKVQEGRHKLERWEDVQDMASFHKDLQSLDLMERATLLRQEELKLLMAISEAHQREKDSLRSRMVMMDRIEEQPESSSSVLSQDLLPVAEGAEEGARAPDQEVSAKSSLTSDLQKSAEGLRSQSPEMALEEKKRYISEEIITLTKSGSVQVAEGSRPAIRTSLTPQAPSELLSVSQPVSEEEALKLNEEKFALERSISLGDIPAALTGATVVFSQRETRPARRRLVRRPKMRKKQVMPPTTSGGVSAEQKRDWNISQTQLTAEEREKRKRGVTDRPFFRPVPKIPKPPEKVNPGTGVTATHLRYSGVPQLFPSVENTGNFILPRPPPDQKETLIPVVDAPTGVFLRTSPEDGSIQALSVIPTFPKQYGMLTFDPSACAELIPSISPRESEQLWLAQPDPHTDTKPERGIQPEDVKNLKEYVSTLPLVATEEREQQLRHGAANTLATVRHQLPKKHPEVPVSPRGLQCQSAVKNVQNWAHRHIVKPPPQSCRPPTKGSLGRRRWIQDVLIHSILRKQQSRKKKLAETSQEQSDNAAGPSAEEKQRQDGSHWSGQSKDGAMIIPECRLLCLEVNQSWRKAGRTLALMKNDQLDKVLTEPGCQHIWNKFQQAYP